MTKWAPSYCDLHKGNGFSVSYRVRTFRLVDGRRCCTHCLRDPGVRWLMWRANATWFSDSVSVDWSPPNWLLKMVEP